jgi:hypothetical protein
MNVEEVYVRIPRSHFVPGLTRIHVSLFRHPGQELLQRVLVHCPPLSIDICEDLTLCDDHNP